MQQLHQPIVLAIAVCSSSQPNRRRLPCSSQQLQTPVPPPLAATFCLATCRARRPFHPGRLWDFLRSYWVLQQVESLGEEEEEEGEEGEEGEGKAGGKRPATDDKRQAAAAGGPKTQKGGAAASTPASGRGGGGQEPAGGDAEEDGSSGAGLVIVAEDVSASEAAARQAELKRRFGQVRPLWGQACLG